VQTPVGFWDPMGFLKDGDVDDFKRRRGIELKHGRVALYAAMGFITPEYFKLPSYLSPSAGLKFEDVPNGLAAIGKVSVEGWLQWIARCGFYEMGVNESNASEPGNYGRGRLVITGKSMEDPAKRMRSLSLELATAAWPWSRSWAGCSRAAPSTPLARRCGSRAVPSGASWACRLRSASGTRWASAKDGDVGDFKRRRGAELRHRRVATCAAMGFVTPGCFKLPGYLSPSAGLEFGEC
jgi:light-harvesting complex I chlorophyll a/b binding protein 1